MGHLIPAGTGFPLHRDMKIIHLGEVIGGAEPALPSQPSA